MQTFRGPRNGRTQKKKARESIGTVSGQTKNTRGDQGGNANEWLLLDDAELLEGLFGKENILDSMSLAVL